jgi:hypothetical protein
MNRIGDRRNLQRRRRKHIGHPERDRTESREELFATRPVALVAHQQFFSDPVTAADFEGK